MNRINIDELLEILPKLIRENDRVKGAIISALSGVVATHEDIVELTKQMDKRFEAMDKRFETMQQSMDKRFEAMDKRFETMQQSMDKRFETMDKRFETMDKRFETMQQSMDKRFEAIDKRFEAMDKRFDNVTIILQNIQQSLGKPFEQFGRNIIIKILESEGYKKVELEPKKLKDPESFVSEGTTEIEIDGFSFDPPIIVEITSILRTKNKINIFLRKKEFIEKEYGTKFRGFFVAASTEFSAEEMGEIAIKLRKKNCEIINL